MASHVSDRKYLVLGGNWGNEVEAEYPDVMGADAKAAAIAHAQRIGGFVTCRTEYVEVESEHIWPPRGET